MKNGLGLSLEIFGGVIKKVTEKVDGICSCVRVLDLISQSVHNLRNKII